MRLSGVDPSLWSKSREKLLRHMFILDLIRDFNKFVAETMVTWTTSAVKDKETWEQLHGIINRYKRSALYTIFTEEEQEKYQDSFVKTDTEIMAEVANM